MPRIALIAAALLLGAAPAFAQSGDEATRTLEQNRRAVLTAAPRAAPARQANTTPPPPLPATIRPAVTRPNVAGPTGIALAQEVGASRAR
jgi:hypothetical protein